MDSISITLLTLALLCLTPWLWRFFIRPYFAKDTLYHQLRTRPDWPTIKKTENLFTKLYSPINAHAISKRERHHLGLTEDAYTYGEIQFLSFFSILERVKPQPGEVFYDLGCGSGRAIFCAGLCYDFAKVCGIEILPALCEIGKKQLGHIKNLIKYHPKDLTETWLRRTSHIQFINDNFLNQDFSDADIVFIAATCLSYPTWEKLVDRLTHLKIGSRIIVTTKKIENDKFQLQKNTLEWMSWGMSSVNVYVKIRGQVAP